MEASTWVNHQKEVITTDGAHYGKYTGPATDPKAGQDFAQRVPDAPDLWLNRLRAVNHDEIWGILERVPAERLSAIGKQFTLELLLTNQRRLLE